MAKFRESTPSRSVNPTFGRLPYCTCNHNLPIGVSVVDSTTVRSCNDTFWGLLENFYSVSNSCPSHAC